MHSGGKTISYQCRQTGCASAIAQTTSITKRRLACPSRGTFSASFEYLVLWCWRCKTEMPMLDDDEYRQVLALRPTGKGGSESLNAMFIPMLAEYERITGFRETNPNAVFHHRLSEYGPPCRHCGKPLRTPQAKFCGHCMKPVG